MAIMMIMSWPGVSLEQYDEVRAVVDWENDEPVGGMFHATAHDGKGLRITDIWESADHFQNFVNDRLMPGIAKAGSIEGEPQVEIYPLHDVFAPGV